MVLTCICEMASRQLPDRQEVVSQSYRVGRQLCRGRRTGRGSISIQASRAAMLIARCLPLVAPPSLLTATCRATARATYVCTSALSSVCEDQWVAQRDEATRHGRRSTAALIRMALPHLWACLACCRMSRACLARPASVMAQLRAGCDASQRQATLQYRLRASKGALHVGGRCAYRSDASSTPEQSR